MAVKIIDYGMGNLQSIRRACEECGASVMITDNPLDLGDADHIILPGVGAFADAMRNLQQKDWLGAINRAAQKGVPFLGICLGMQLLASKGFEGGETDGLNLIPGEVRVLRPPDTDLRIPHVGWNEIKSLQPNLLFTNIHDGTDFYFVHSYHFVPHDSANVVTVTDYGIDFVSAVTKGNVFGVQFHPEKSQRAGFQLIKNFLSNY